MSVVRHCVWGAFSVMFAALFGGCGGTDSATTPATSNTAGSDTAGSDTAGSDTAGSDGGEDLDAAARGNTGGDDGSGASTDGDAIVDATSDAVAPDKDASTAGAITFDDFAAQLPGALCEWHARCAPVLATWQCAPGSASTDAFEMATAWSVELQRTLLARGTVAWHGDRAVACLERYASGPCTWQGPNPEAPLPTPAECQEALEGLVAAAGDCSRDEECADPGGHYCAGSVCVPTGQPTGTCVARPMAGESCSAVACGSGLTCTHGFCPFDSCPSNDTCVAATEKETAQEGEACGTADTVCAGGLVCSLEAGTCRKYGQVGERCTDGGLPCDPRVGVCMMGPETIENGIPMPPQGACAAFGSADEGAPCMTGLCKAGLVCVQGPPTGAEVCMKAGVAVGATCHHSRTGSDCIASAYCDWDAAQSTSTCKTLVIEGMACKKTGNQSPCGQGLLCLLGTCTAAMVGDPCTVDSGCLSGKCGAGGTCVEPWGCSGG